MDLFPHIPPIVECIFKHLPARDLANCAQVCKLWSSMSATELKRRKGISWFFQVSQCKIHDFHDFIPGRHSSSCEENVSECEGELLKQLSSLRVHTKLCIAFATYTVLERFEAQPHKKRTKKDTSLPKKKYFNSVKTALGSHLPTQCTTIFAVAPGLIGSLEDKFPIEIEEGFAVSGFCFPNIPGVQIHHFSVKNWNCDMSDLIPSETKIKCLLAFLNPGGVIIVDKLVRSCLLKEKERVAVGGVIVDKTDAYLGSVVVFCGENIEAASLIIDSNDQTEEDVKKKLEVFKETGLLKNRCYAFMFAYKTRGHNLYVQHNLVSLTFHAMYPEVPLIGVFGEAEIGVKYLPHLPTENKLWGLSTSALLRRCLHRYTTVFVLFSIKD